MASKSEFNNQQKYGLLLNETFNLVDYSRLEQVPNLWWFDKYFGHNGEAFKMQSRIGKYFLAAVILGICVALPPFIYSFTGWIDYLQAHKELSNSWLANGVIFFISLGSIATGALVTYLVAKLFWVKYKKPYIEIKSFVIKLFDEKIIDYEQFIQFPEQILILTKLKKFWPSFKIRETDRPVVNLLQQYCQMSGSHNDRVTKIAKTINDVPFYKNSIMFFKSNYNYNNIFLFCGAIYWNCRINKKI